MGTDCFRLISYLCNVFDPQSSWPRRFGSLWFALRRMVSCWKSASRSTGWNSECPKTFVLWRVWSGYQAYRQTWKSRVKDQIRFQSAVAQQEVQDIPEPDAECDLEEQLVQPIFSSEPNQALIAAQFESSFGRELPFSPNHDADFRHMCVQLQSWIHFKDSSASRMRNVSLLEIYVMFRVSLPGRFPLSSGGRKPGLFDVITFAADFSYFKKLWRFLFAWADLPWTTGTCTMSHVRIFCPQASCTIGWSYDSEATRFLHEFYRSKASVFISGVCKAMATLRLFFVRPQCLRWIPPPALSWGGLLWPCAI